MGLDSQISYFQAGESLDAENGAPGETDNLNRPLKNLVAVLENGEANVQVRRLNIKIAGAQDVGDGVVSDDAVFFNTTTSKYEKAVSNNANTLGIIDVENLIIYTHGEYTLKNTTLVAGSSYYVSSLNAGELVLFTDTNAGITHVGEALSTTMIAINLYTNSSLQVSAVIDDDNVANDTAFSSEEIVSRIADAEIDINSLPNKANPVDADKAVIADSEDSDNLKNIDLSLILNSNVVGSILPITGYCFFDGTTGTASSIGGVVSSISRIGTGLYDVVLTLTNTNILFIPMMEKNQAQGSPRGLSLASDTLTTTFARLDRRVCDTSGNLEDSSRCGFIILGGV